VTGARLLLAISALAGACTNETAATPSTDVATEKLSFVVDVRSDGAVTQVIVEHFLELSPPDGLYARTRADDETTLVPFGGRTLVTQFGAAVPSVVLGLARSGGVRVETPIALPPPFSIRAPIASVSRKTPIVLEWDPPPVGSKHTVAIEASGECIQPIRRSLGIDTGTFTLQPADFFAVGAPRPCVLTIEIRRQLRVVATWSATPAPSTSITTHQARAASFTTTP
jgi:hypothetical protein